MFGITLIEWTVIVAVAAAVMFTGKREPILPLLHKAFDDIREYCRQEPEKCLLVCMVLLTTGWILALAVLQEL